MIVIFYYIRIFKIRRLFYWWVYKCIVFWNLFCWFFMTIKFLFAWLWGIILKLISDLNFNLWFFVLFIWFLRKCWRYFNIFYWISSLCIYRLKWTSCPWRFLLNYICNWVLPLFYLGFSKFKQSSWNVNSRRKLFTNFNFLFLKFKILRLFN